MVNRSESTEVGMREGGNRRRIARGAVVLAILLSVSQGLGQEHAIRRMEFLQMFARDYYPGRSGQIMVVPRENFILTRRDASYRFMHGSPWDYDVRVPLIFYGHGYFKPGQYPETAHHQDIMPTLAALLKLPLPATVTGHALTMAVGRQTEPPRAVLLAVLDAARADYLDKHAGALPTLLRLRKEGASFSNARLDYLPSATAVAHATISSGTDPRFHGIVVNTAYDRVRARSSEPYFDRSPASLMVPTLADLWSIETRGRAVIYAQGGLFYAAAALAGHGACFWDGRTVMAASYDAVNGSWETNPQCYQLPGYLKSMDARSLWEGTSGRWLNHDVSNTIEVRRSALFPAFEARAVVSVIEHEAIGSDAVTDLLLANLKSLDFVGHKYGPDSPEISATLTAMDKALAEILSALDRKVGPDRYVVAITADHGMPPEPASGESGRVTEPELAKLIHDRFDPSGRLIRVYEAANGQLHLDRDRLSELGVTLTQIAQFLETQKFIYAAYTEDEVRGVKLGSPRTQEP